MFYTHKNGVEFRKVEKSDLQRLKELKDESWFGTVNIACLNMTDQERWFDKISNDKSCLFFMAYPPLSFLSTNYCQQSIEKPCALFGLTNIDGLNQSCEFTHSVFKERRGLGLGKSTLRAGIDMAFEVFNMRRIETWILENNQAEMKTAFSVGFVVEGVKKAAVYKCGEYINCNLLGLLRSEWEEQTEVLSYKAEEPCVGVCNTSYSPKTVKK